MKHLGFDNIVIIQLRRRGQAHPKGSDCDGQRNYHLQVLQHRDGHKNKRLTVKNTDRVDTGPWPFDVELFLDV